MPLREPPAFEKPNESPPTLSSDLDGHTLRFRPMVRLGIFSAMCIVVSQGAGGILGTILATVLFLACMWLGYFGFTQQMRVSAHGVVFESRLAGWLVRSQRLSFDEIKSVKAMGSRYWSSLCFVPVLGPDLAFRVGTRDDHEKLAEWLGDLAQARGAPEGSLAEVPESLRRLTAAARSKVAQ